MQFDEDRYWYYAIDGRQAGPVAGRDIRRLLADGTLGRRSLLWTEGMPAWVELSDLTGLLHGSPPPTLAMGPISTAIPLAPVDYAGFWIRAVATVIDGIVVAAIGAVLGALFGYGVMMTSGRLPSQVTVNGIATILGVLVNLGYYGSLTSGGWQATLGKRIVGIHVIRADRAPIGAGLAIGRYLAYILSALPMFLGFMLAGWTDEKRALHDMVCRTRVVYGRL